MQNRNKKKQYDQNSKAQTTGHQWDGIEEYKNPDPFWLRLFFYGALFFSLGYWLLYPSWPTPNNTGLFKWSSYQELAESQKEIEALRAQYQNEFDKSSFDEILNNPRLLKFALAAGKSIFENNCAPCHGAGGGGAKGYPNLTSGSWLWGGKIDDIYTTLKYGIRSGHEDSRDSQMAAFGKDQILNPEQVALLANYVISLRNTLNTDGENTDNSIQNKLFQENCASCHGTNGKGNQELGAPNLRDAISLYGNDYNTVYDVIYSGRQGVMPYWIGKLSDTSIRQVAIYVHQLGGGE